MSSVKEFPRKFLRGSWCHFSFPWSLRGPLEGEVPGSAPRGLRSTAAEQGEKPWARLGFAFGLGFGWPS